MVKKVILSNLLLLACIFVQAQIITSFSPVSGPVGTSVVISGTGFSPTPANNIVFFGATQAAVTAATATQLTVTVPFGATYKPISVSVIGGGVALSGGAFLVTFANGGIIDACTFAPRVEYSTSSASPGGVILTDFDGDGKEDVGITVGVSNVFGVFRNTSTSGSTSFDPRINFATGVGPDGLAVGDLDGDGKPDVAVVSVGSQTVSILLNTSTPGTISFAAKVDVGASLTNGRHIAISDIDGDGKLDVVVPNNFTKVSVLRNQSTPGSVAFDAKVDFTVNAASTTPWDVVATDLDGDGKPDLAVSLTASTNMVSVLRNTSTTGAVSFDAFVQFATATTPFDIEASDLDGDLKTDLVTANLGSNSVSILRNTSTTGILDASSFAPKIDYFTSSFPNSIALDDFNGDGIPDIAVGRNPSTLDLTVLRSTSSPGNIIFQPAINYLSGPIAGGGHFVAAGDIDNDGKADVVLTHVKFSVFLNSTVTAAPTVDSYTPTLGPIGTTVTITGTNFSTILSRNTVKFNGVTAAVTSSTATEIVATVPFNATPGPITVTVGCNAANIGTGLGVFTVNGDCVTSIERNALVQFYNTTNGPNWSNNTNWLSADESTWFGVTVSGCYVTSIGLGENNLTGFLPSQLGDLKHLTELWLKENLIGGNIPTRVGELANLEFLELSSNAFTSMSNFSSSLLDKNNLNFNVNHNQLDFGTLEPNMVFDLLNYSPQELIYPGDLAPFIPGQPVTIAFTASGTENSYQWYKDGSPIGAPATDGNYFKDDGVVGDAGLYRVEITNTLVPGLTLQSDLFTVVVDPCDPQPRVDGTVDDTFDPEIASPTQVTAVAAQSGGKVVAAVAGSGIVRFNLDGTLDGSFTVSGQLAAPHQLLVQQDDKIIVGTPSGSLIRLNADGTNDNSFNSANGDFIYGIAIQPDGKILYSAAGESPPFLNRLDINGDYDPAFSAPEDLPAYAIVVQSDDYILLGGPFPGGITRLDPSGAIDPTFVGDLGGEVVDIALQSDGKIIAIGAFTDAPLRGIVRLNSDGSIDNTFSTTGITGMFYGMYPSNVMLQADGKIIISGLFDAAQGSVRTNLIRLNQDGTADCSFDPGLSTNTAIMDMASDSGQRILISGNFTWYDGTARFGLARVNNTASSSCLPASERAALVALYNSTNGAGWITNTNWLSVDESTWNGVTVSGCHVTQISLSEDNLVGTIPPEIGNLPQLTDLILSGNRITGTLPASITNLTNLQYLYLDNNNGITGPLPANMGNLSSLRIINTQGNAFTGPIPASMANCLALEDIHLEGNQHTGTLPAYFSTFPNLYSINLGFNTFSGSVPPEWGGITNLGFLSVASNNLTGSIPVELGDLVNLNLMDLSRNQLSGVIPPEFGNMGSLGSLQLWSNQLTGPIPPELGNILTLEDLNLSENQLTGSIPVELGNLSALAFLQVYTNQLTGPIPTELFDATSLVFIRLSNNHLTGTIPSAVQNLTGLFLFELDRNQLTGPIPPELGNNSQMKSLLLNTNQLSGPIPSVLGNLTELTDLLLYDNQLTGSLPIELGQCVNLRRFGVGNNLLTGTLPVEYSSWTGLTDFGVNDNDFTGAVPIEYLAWTQVILLYFSGNQLDAIPAFSAGTITEYNVFDNLLDFGDLEPSIPAPGTFNYSPQADLPGGSFNVNAGSPLTIPFSTSGTANQYQWFKNGVLIPGATTATFSIASPSVSDAGNYTVAVTNTIVTGLTINSLPFVVGVTPVITITVQPSDFIACEGTVATFNAGGIGTTNILYQWQFSPDGVVPFADISNGGGYSNATTSTLSVITTGPFGVGRYRCRINGDLAVEVITFDEGLFVNPVPPTPTTSGNSSCTSASLTMTAFGGSNGNYRWYTVATGGTALVGEVNDSYVTPVLAATTTYFVSISNGSCESTRTPVIAAINTVAKPAVVTSLCTATSATLTGPTGFPTYAWSNGATTQQILVTTAGSYTLVVTAATGCSSVASDPVVFTSVFCNQPPSITATTVTTTIAGTVKINLISLVSDLDNNIDFSTFQILVQPTSGATVSINANFELIIDYSSVAFAGTDQLTIQVCDAVGVCTQEVITIEVAGDITVYNALSPNGDGKNEAFYIQYIDALPNTKNNKLIIFNRWGDIVFEATNYDNTNNVFRGIGKNGSDLPTGTYYYSLEFTSGEPKRTGFISLRR